MKKIIQITYTVEHQFPCKENWYEYNDTYKFDEVDEIIDECRRQYPDNKIRVLSNITTIIKEIPA